MKKILFSLFAVAALASCVKSEDFYTEDNAEIKIKPATAIATKANQLAAIDGTEYPVAENFDVYAYWADEPAGSDFTDATVYLGIDGPAVEFKNKGNYWGGVTTYYWPKNGSLRFAAYSPSSVDMKHDLATDTYTVDGYTQPATTDATWDLLVAPTSVSYDAMTAAENVSVVFEHALSWITVKVVAKDAEAAKAFDIKKVTINDVVNVADLSAVMSGADKAFNWDLSETKVPYVVFNGSQAVTETATVIETVKDGTLVIPQPTTTITVDYTQNALAGTPALENQKVTVDLVLDTDDTPWEDGKHYVYTLVFGLDEILINPDVVDWEDVVVEEVEVGTNNVYSLTQLEDALAEGGNAVLKEDIEATEPININGNLDGEGHIVSATDGVDYVISNTARLIEVTAPAMISDLKIDGKSVYSGDFGIRGIYTIGTGDITIDNVEILNCTYAINANNAGKLAVSNSTLQGWNSYGSTTLNTFKNVKFIDGQFHNFRPYNNTLCENCDFASGIVIDLSCMVDGATIKFVNCTYAGQPLTAANLTDAEGVDVSLDMIVTEQPENNGLVANTNVVKDMTIDGGNLTTTDGKGLRGIYITKGGEYNVENVVVKNVTYAINVNTTEAVTLNVKNSELEGWTSYGESTTASFENVKFTCGTYANFKPYSNTTLTDCSFEAGFMIDFTALNGVITLKNCTYNGNVLTAENFASTAKTDGDYTGKIAF